MKNWNCIQHAEKMNYSITANGTEQNTLRLYVEDCATKAIDLLNDNIRDDSLYLLFEWNTNAFQLTAVVTDAQKEQDGLITVSVNFPDLQSHFETLTNDEKAEYAESIKFWLHDYLTTCTAFFKYSLVAIFHSSNRQETELL